MIRRRAVVLADSKPYLPRHVRVQFDATRQHFAVLAPERVYWPDETAVDILKRCNGRLTIGDIAAQLAGEYTAPVETIQADVPRAPAAWRACRAYASLPASMPLLFQPHSSAQGRG